ncbi:MAG: lipopolysaccharide heptosyltransferase II [Candidatus Omnitrophica bacterium]|nr:lipopolysaccharide heptosyltransferase II [Candidatus Omnitrophota bacterium]
MPTPPKKILVIRTDRIGDLVLSTPVIRALRTAYPQAHIGVMVRPSNRELVEGNPDLDEVILYDKDRQHKSWAASLQFARELKKKNYDTSLILHSTNRVILVSFLAGIRRRIGYARRLGWLLTDSVPYVKREGQKHELEYNLDLLKKLGIDSKERRLFVPVQPRHEEKIDRFLLHEGIHPKVHPIVVIHPGASCPSKRWPIQRFAAVADRLIERHHAGVVVVTGPEEVETGKEMIRRMARQPAAALGTLGLGELACLLKRARCLLSNDSGPVHIGCAVGTPVVSIFGRWGGGLSPTRWGPTGENSIVLHQDVGCRPCLAHNCTIGFACLKAVSLKRVQTAVEYAAGFKNVRPQDATIEIDEE